MDNQEFDAKNHSSDMYKDYLKHNSEKIAFRQTQINIEVEDNNDNSLECERPIYLKESDLNFLIEILEPIQKKFLSNV